MCGDENIPLCKVDPWNGTRRIQRSPDVIEIALLANHATCRFTTPITLSTTIEVRGGVLNPDEDGIGQSGTEAAGLRACACKNGEYSNSDEYRAKTYQRSHNVFARALPANRIRRRIATSQTRSPLDELRRSGSITGYHNDVEGRRYR